MTKMFNLAYRVKVRALKTSAGNRLWRYWKAMRGEYVGSYSDIPKYVKDLSPGKSFVDIGCMWGVDGEYAFLAEEAGATSVKGVDVFGPTPEFVEKKQRRNSSVEFVLGDATQPSTLEAIGPANIVLCAGVLYHHPSPFDLLVALRRICTDTLILRTSTIPEINGLANGAVYWPMLNEQDRRFWNLSSLGVARQVGISNAFEPAQGYGNWFWGLTPSCLLSLLETAGFKCDFRATEAFAQTVICSAVEAPFHHRLPDDNEAIEMANEISNSGIAKPA